MTTFVGTPGFAITLARSTIEKQFDDELANHERNDTRKDSNEDCEIHNVLMMPNAWDQGRAAKRSGASLGANCWACIC